ncbi:GerMN domain-containing protein [Myxosarcina sp. GI1]|uniref:GerMN domain-containing protein n=1 Tax=Myxosarcina sp. GI1 TaxID=1541065 RepID=UPI000691261A|nr:GerMN domain-containing protein [Myxosarcina sp. GI1]
MKLLNKSPNFIPIGIGFILLAIGMAQVTALWALQKAILPDIIKSLTVEQVNSAEFSPQIYWLEIVDNRIQLTSKATNIVAASPEIALQKALNKLFAQSSIFGFTTTIPKQTELLDLHVNKTGIYINLSREFSQGGGSSSMIYRVAQVLYTATSIDSQAQVWLSIEGRPLDEHYLLGGEGLLLEYPLTRQKFSNDFLNQ